MEQRERHGVEAGLTKGRVESLTDGIYGFAMTLLVIGVGLPGYPTPTDGMAVGSIVVELIPDFIHYVIAFLILARFWMSHHIQFARIEWIDRRILWINTFSLLFIALVPFSTSLMGDYPTNTEASIIFDANMMIIGLLYFWQWRYASRDGRFISQHLDRLTIETATRTNIVIPLLSVVGIGLALIGVSWTSLIYIAAPALIIVARRWNEGRPSGAMREDTVR
jgi:uncharacterized membrane protein